MGNIDVSRQQFSHAVALDDAINQSYASLAALFSW
jgi:hypothetical protein